MNFPVFVDISRKYGGFKLV